MLETERDQTGPHIKQLSIFLPNRVGALLRVVRKLEENNVRICALSILDSIDHAVVRLVVDRPAVATEALKAEENNVFETELLGVELPKGGQVGIRKVLAALLLAEVNVHYVYSLIVHADHRPVLALHVDDLPAATKVLRNHGLTVIGHDEIEPNVDY